MMVHARKLAKAEFRSILETYILPLFDVQHKLKEQNIDSEPKCLIEGEDGAGFIKVYPCLNNPQFCFSFGVYNNDGTDRRRARTILEELMKVSQYKYDTPNFKVQRYYGFPGMVCDTYKSNTFNLAFELGMCRSLVRNSKRNSTNSVILYNAISMMEEWSSTTYEGEKIPFGIIIDFADNTNSTNPDYIKFLKNPHSAAFSDGVFSGVMLNRDGNVLEYFSIDSPAENFKKDKHIPFVPYKFQGFVNKCDFEKIGIIVLMNGELLLIENKELRFAKRANKWIFFNWMRVNNALRKIFEDNKIDDIDSKIKEIYNTLLDVSFSHTGGCLGIILPEHEKNEEYVGQYIKDRIDNDSCVDDRTKGKINVVKQFIKGKSEYLQSFYILCRKLRQEMLSLDGATTITLEGNIISCGSIVKIEGGSDSGGRSAAAKQLAAKFGIGIKISEDGYIEAYRDNRDLLEKETNKETDKVQDDFIPLFNFK